MVKELALTINQEDLKMKQAIRNYHHLTTIMTVTDKIITVELLSGKHSISKANYDKSAFKMAIRLYLTVAVNHWG
jgi:hypothetical protein